MQRLIPTHIIENYKNAVYNGSMDVCSLFVDISGFTTLTEGLMQHGRIGAELLSKALNDTFSPNISTISQQGGFVTTFAGDAYMSIFAGSDSNTIQRVIQAAFDIQNFFKAYPAIKTEYGNYELSLFPLPFFAPFGNLSGWKPLSVFNSFSVQLPLTIYTWGFIREHLEHSNKWVVVKTSF